METRSIPEVKIAGYFVATKEDASELAKQQI